MGTASKLEGYKPPIQSSEVDCMLDFGGYNDSVSYFFPLTIMGGLNTPDYEAPVEEVDVTEAEVTEAEVVNFHDALAAAAKDVAEAAPEEEMEAAA